MDKGLDTGIFTISLDFELHWGVSEHRSIESYGHNLKNVPRVVEQLLSIFEEYEIHATWATVGMLFNEKKGDFDNWVDPKDYPQYENPKLSNYKIIKDIGNNVSDDPYHYALPLIKSIEKSKGQEIATHTYSHYYCLEKGQTLDNFEKDLDVALAIAKNHNYTISSIVFPRNQYNNDHIKFLGKNGISTYRGNENHWMYKPRSRAEETKIRKLARLIDSYVKISGDNTHVIRKADVLNIPSSRFLRPYDHKLRIFDGLRLKRICKEMTFAAKNNRVYHLWWHPHNFGFRLKENFQFLNQILKHAEFLKNKYALRSLNMSEITRLVNEQ